MMAREPLWTAETAAAATGGRTAGTWRALGVSIDSRTVAKNDLFIALPGPNFDGHDYVADALARGAAAAMVSRRPAGVEDDRKLLMVVDSMKALQDLGRAARDRSRAKVVAVTGSAGKTGVKEAIRACLATQGSVAHSIGSLNNHWGVPLSLSRMDRDSDYGVFEAGMNHAGELSVLTRMIRPHVAVITNVEAAHVEFFPNLEAVADAKAEILEGIEPGGAAVLNRDSPFFGQLAAHAARNRNIARIVSFGRAESAEVRLVEADIGPVSSRVRATIFGRTIEFTVGMAGPHWVMNALATLAAVSALGAHVDRAAQALAAVSPLPGRGQRLQCRVAAGPITVIDDSYNANPASMRAAIATLAAAPVEQGARRIAVLGEMRELGAQSEVLHAGLAQPLVDARIDLVFTSGAAMAALDAALPRERRGGHFADARATAAAVAAALRAGDVVMVKGSNASGMKAVVDALCSNPPARKRAANG
jgi:UDP-N-acetylmuramoyl-tripeptide--D-alanyl-D-alanine ligase